MKRADETYEDKRARREREKAAYEADPEGFKTKVREANLRAGYAHVTTLLKLCRDERDPVTGLVYIAFPERGEPFWAFAGAIRPVETLGALECFKAALVNVFAERDPARFWITGDLGLGDTLEVGDDGEIAIKCGGDDLAEADREKAENANRLVRELVMVARDFYGDEVPDAIAPALAALGTHVDLELERLKPENYYQESADGE